MSMSRLCCLLAVCALALVGPGAWARSAKFGGFFLHDGDRVVFYGDSITEQQMYGRDIETFVATRYPKMHVSFLNSGWSGDRVTGGGGGPIDVRLNRDVLPYRPTVVTILLGMNDGNYASFDPATFQTYTQGMTHIVDVLTRKLPGVRLTLLTPTFFDYGARPRQLPPAGQGYNYGTPAPDYNQTLLKYGAFLKQFGAQRHILVVDLNAPMQVATEAGRSKDPTFSLFGAGLTGDGVHPDEVGHLIMAASVLTAWNAQGLVAEISSAPSLPLPFTAPLPWPVPDDALQAFALSPQADALNTFIVHFPRARHPRVPASVSYPSREYSVSVDGNPVATASAAQFAAGVDLTQYPNLPENQQAQQVLALVNQRINTWHDFFKGGSGIAHANDVPTDAEVASLTAENTSLDALRTQEYQAAQPKAHTFEVLPVPVAQP